MFRQSLSKMAKGTNGKISDSVRRTQALPLSWDIPATSEIENLRRRLWELTDRRKPPPAPAKIEGAILLVLCMQTGEHSGAVFGAFRGLNALAIAPPLLVTCGSENSVIAVKPTADTLPIHLPQTKLLTRLLALQTPPSEPYDLLFKCSLSDIEAEARDLVRGGADWKIRTPKAARTLLAHSRWLFRRLREASNGDPALVSVLTPDRPAAERTLTAYCAVPQKTLVKRYRRAIRPLGSVSPMPQNDEMEKHLVGRAKLPINDQLRQDILNIRRLLARPMLTPNAVAADKLFGLLPVSRDWHLAMMTYTYILTTFGTGQRGKRAPCGEIAIDRESGFAWVVEKGNAKLGLAGSRGVYHCRTVREQLTRYEDYLDGLERKLERRDSSLAEKLRTLRGDGEQLVFFDVTAEGVKKLTPYALCAAACAIGWKHHFAMGRRWLRSQLTAALPSDALAAQFGHNLDGLDVWSPHSGLQVKALPGILGPAIERALSSIGLEPSSARHPKRRPKLDRTPDTLSSKGPEPSSVRLARRRSKPDRTPDTQTIIRNTRERSGQVLASMIWHGAFLRPNQFAGALRALNRLDPSKETLPWILLHEANNAAVGCEDTYENDDDDDDDDEPNIDESEGTVRYVLDPITADLVRRYYEAKLPFSPKLRKVVPEYFKPSRPFETFLAAAMTRWRYKLPPILYAKAMGKLNNYDLPNNQIQTGLEPSPIEPKAIPSFSPAAWKLIGWLNGMQANRRKRVRGHKCSLHTQLRAQSIEQPFWAEMTTLERWLTLACIELLVVHRGKQNTVGYSLSTIINIARRVFGHFASNADGRHGDLALNEWRSEDIALTLPRTRIRYNVAMDLVKLIKAYTFEDENADILDMLNERPENRRSFVVTPDLYSQILASEVQFDKRVALTLCFKAGLRIDELKVLDKDMFTKHGNTFTLRLDHKPNWRLKTFHSRRIIPLDVLLDDEELLELRCLRAERESWLFPFQECKMGWVDTLQDLLKIAGEFVSPQPYVSAWGLRHSFATNTYAALLWPDSEQPRHATFFDPALLSRRNAVRERLCGKASLGAIGPHALATVMGHTSPSRTLYSYAHNLEFILAAHVATWQKEK